MNFQLSFSNRLSCSEGQKLSTVLWWSQRRVVLPNRGRTCWVIFALDVKEGTYVRIGFRSRPRSCCRWWWRWASCSGGRHLCRPEDSSGPYGTTYSCSRSRWGVRDIRMNGKEIQIPQCKHDCMLTRCWPKSNSSKLCISKLQVLSSWNNGQRKSTSCNCHYCSSPQSFSINFVWRFKCARRKINLIWLQGLFTNGRNLIF